MKQSRVLEPEVEGVGGRTRPGEELRRTWPQPHGVASSRRLPTLVPLNGRRLESQAPTRMSTSPDGLARVASSTSGKMFLTGWRFGQAWPVEILLTPAATSV